MEEQKEGNIPEVMPETNVPETVDTAKELDMTTPIQEKLTEIEEKQDMIIPEVVKEIAEVIILAAAVTAGDKEVKTEKVKVKKPTKSDPIIMYGDNVVMWYIET